MITKPQPNIEEYTKEIASDFQRAMITAKAARSKGLDPSKDIEVEILTDSFNVETEKHFYDSNSYESSFLECLDYAKKNFGFIEPPSFYINQVLKHTLITITGDDIIFETNIVTFSIEKDQSGYGYLVINLNEATRYLTHRQIIFIIILANELRKILGLSKPINQYNNPIEDIIEKILRIYEDGYLSYEPDITKITKFLQNMPIYLNLKSNKATKKSHNYIYSYSSHTSVNTDLVKFVNDVINNNINFLLNLAHSANINDWDWMAPLIPIQNKTSSLHTKNRITISKATVGAFRLVYGRAQNTSIDTIGIHPSIVELFNNLLVPGSLVYISGLGHFTISIVDTLEPPLVKLISGDVLYVKTPHLARQIRNQIDKIVQCGTILISPARLLSQGKPFLDAGYDLIQWINDVKSSLLNYTANADSPINVIINRITSYKPGNSFTISFSEALIISKTLNVPLFPEYNLNWNAISVDELLELVKTISWYKTEKEPLRVELSANTMTILERLGIEFKKEGNLITISKPYSEILSTLSDKAEKKPPIDLTDTLGYVEYVLGCKIIDKTGEFLGVSVETNHLESMSTRLTSHILFPVKSKQGKTVDLISYCKLPEMEELTTRRCLKCKKISPYLVCPFCGSDTTQIFYCVKCKNYVESNICKTCGNMTQTFHNELFDWRVMMENAIQRCQVQPYAPLKGVSKPRWHSKYVERIEKGILRQRNSLLVSKDGTIKFSLTNSPLIAFTPKQISTNVVTLKHLGYEKDIYNELLNDENQFVYIKPQDVVISFSLADQLRKVADFVDEMLTKLYGLPPYYNIKTLDDLVGKLIVGQSQSTTFGILGRVIGFTEANVCFAHPVWHTSKRSNCRGRSDYVMLLLDSLVNFSAAFIEPTSPDRIGSLQTLKPFINLDRIRKSQLVDLNFEYDLDFFRSVRESMSTKSIEDTQNISEESKHGIYPSFTTLSSSLVSSQNVSSLKQMNELEQIYIQIKIANISQSLNLEEISRNLLVTKLIPKTLKLMNEYTTQKFICKNCGRNYRRPTLRGLCLICEKKLQPYYTPDHVERYITLVSRIISDINIDSSVQETIKFIKDNFESLFYEKKQTTLSDYI